jgi:hypothetical protein
MALPTPQYERWRKTRLALGDLGPYLEVIPGRTYLLTAQAGAPVVTLLFTERYPLTDGTALGAPAADPSDVTVTVDGLAAAVWGLDALPGVVYLEGEVAEGAVVEVSYSWTPHLTLPFSGLNNPNLVFNQGGNANLGGAPWRAVSLPGTHVQPPLAQHRYTGEQRAYSNLLNDPLLLRFNVSARNAGRRLEADRQRETAGYEGNTQPTDPSVGPWVQVGSPLGVLDGSGGYVLTDGSAVPSPGGLGGVNFFRQRLEAALSGAQDVTVACNVRFALHSFTLEGDWTGWAWGWSDEARLYWAAALQVPGADWLTLGLLSVTGDESNFRAYRGRRVVLVDRSGAPDGSGKDVLEWPGGEQPPLKAGQRLSLDWGTYVGTVSAILDPVAAGSPDGVSWRVFLEDAVLMASSGQTLELHAELPLVAPFGSVSGRSFRVERTSGPAGRVSLFDVSFAGAGPLVGVDSRDELAVAPEVYGSLVRAGGDLFWGCLGRAALTTVRVDFVRWDIRPDNSLLTSFQVFSAAECSVDPPAELATPWPLLDNEGSRTLLPGGFLRTQAASDVLSASGPGAWAYARREALFTPQAGARARWRVRVDSWAEGSPVAVVLDDGFKHLRLAFWEAPSPVEPERWRSVLGGALTLEEAGWANGYGPLMTQSFRDDRLRLAWAGSPTTAMASVPAPLLNPVPQEAWTLTWRFRWFSNPVLTPSPWDRAPFWAGLEDGELSLYLTVGLVAAVPWVFLCDRLGNVFTQGGLPLGGPFDWTGPPSPPSTTGTRDVEIRMLRNGDWLQVWADGRLVVNLDLVTIPSVQASDTLSPSTRLYVGSAAPATLELDYLFSHSNQHTGSPAVGLWTDATLPLDSILGYDLRSVEWRGVFAELEVRRDPTGLVEVDVNGVPMFSLDYDALPPSPPSYPEPALPASQLPVVAWGTLDATTLAVAVWDYFRFEAYSLVPPSLVRPRPNTNNWAYQITSGEPLFDVGAGRGQAVLSAYNRDVTAPAINLADLERNIGTVLAVTSEDGLSSYGYSWAGDQQSPLILTAPLPPSPLGPVLITFLEVPGSPWTDAYLLDRPAVTRLEEDTPPVPLSQRASFQAVVLPPSPLTNPPAPPLPNVVPFEGGLRLEFRVNPEERAYYQDLRLLTTVQPRPDADALEVACGELVELTFGTFTEDPYSLQPDLELGPAFWIWNLTSWNQGPEVWGAGAKLGVDHSVAMTLSWLEPETLTAVAEVQATAVLTDAYGGSWWNNPLSVFNGPGLGSPVPVAFTWNDAGPPPVVTPIVFVVP